MSAFPRGDCQVVLMGPWGRIDLAHVTHFWAFTDPLRGQFNVQFETDALNQLSRIIHTQGTFYVYSTAPAPDYSTVTHQLDGAVITNIRSLASLTRAPAMVEFTFKDWKRV